MINQELARRFDSLTAEIKTIRKETMTLLTVAFVTVTLLLCILCQLSVRTSQFNELKAESPPVVPTSAALTMDSSK